MKESHRIRNGLHEWNRPPIGYTQLSVIDPVQAGDVQKMNRVMEAD